MSPGDFWRQTPASFAAVMRGRLAAHRREHRRAAWLAYTTAQLTRAAKMPAFDRLLPRDGPRVQSPEEQMAILDRWAAALEGKRA